MARLLTNGAEIGDTSGTCATSTNHPDAVGPSSTAGVVNDGTVARSGSRSWQITSASASERGLNFTPTASTAPYYVRFAFRITALPASGEYWSIARIQGLSPTAGSGNQPVVIVTDTGKVQLWASGGQIGVDSSTISINTFYVVELAWNWAAGAADYVEIRFEGSSLGSSSTLNLTDAGSMNFWTGFNTIPPVGAPGTLNTSASRVINIDDIAVNDSTGASQNSWPGLGKIVLLKPISLNTNGGSWTDDAAATTSAALTNAIDNSPPNGIADTTAGGGNHQVRNAAANSSLDMNMTTYTTAGIGSSDTINVIEPHVNVGAPASTGAKSGSFGVASNPVIANRAFTGGSGTATFFWRGVVPGTYPTNWTTGWERGTVTYGSSVTVGNSPVARLSITGGTTTRIAMSDAMGLYVDYTPAVAATKAPPFQARTARNMLLRR